MLIFIYLVREMKIDDVYLKIVVRIIMVVVFILVLNWRLFSVMDR